MSSGQRNLHLRGALGVPRTEMWDGREHLVVPMVALMEGVLHAVNSKSPEYVSADVIARSVEKWAGHPIVVNHPTRDGKQVSAHDPVVLAAHGCGFIRSSALTNGRLVHETLIDPARLVALKQDALLASLRAGKDVSVSVGAFVTTNDKKSTWNGKAYDGEWSEIGPDHTALLPNTAGACSIEQGCSANRAAQTYLVTAEGFELEALSNPEGINQYSHGGQASAEKARTPAEHQAAADHHRDTAKLESSRGRHEAATAHNYAVSAQQNAANGLRGWSSSARKASEKAGKASLRADVKFSRGLKGASMNLKSLRAKMLALFDTPEQQQSEEDAELVKWTALRATHDALGDAWDEVDGLIDELIEAEAAHATGSAEDAESEVEAAKLDAIRLHLFSMSGSISGMISAAYPTPGNAVSPRYMEQFKALYGKTISKASMAKVQGAHDASHDMHTHTVALGAECSGMKAMAAKQQDCPECGGTGQMKADGKQQDCPTCGGEGVVRAAENGKPCGCHQEVTVEKKERIAALIAAGVKDIDEKTSDEVLAVLEAKVESDKEHATALKAAQDKQVEADAKIKTLEAAQIPAEELASLRALSAEKQQKDTAEKAALVAKLEPLKTLAKADLEAKTLDELKVLARFAKVDVDYGIIGVPVPRNAEIADEFKAPDPYKASIDALRTAAAAK